VLDFLRATPPEDCFVALPSLVGENRMALEVFGPTSARLEQFGAQISTELGTLTGVTERAVTAAQCRVLQFLRSLPSYPAFSSYIQLDDRIIPSGTFLRGRVLGTGARNVHLVIVDNEGRVQSLDRFLLLDGGGVRFRIPMTLTVSRVETWQLLLALSSETRLPLVDQMTGPETSTKFFESLASGLRRSGTRVDVALMAFSVQ
jgi:serine/threonine-protein kinase